MVTLYTAVQAEQESRHSEAKGREAASNKQEEGASGKGGVGEVCVRALRACTSHLDTRWIIYFCVFSGLLKSRMSMVNSALQLCRGP